MRRLEVLPSLSAWRASRCIDIKEGLGRHGWYRIFDQIPNLREEAKPLFEEDLARIRALESKLASHLRFVTVLVPLSTGLISLGFSNKAIVSTVFSLLGTVYLVMAGFGSQLGIRSIKLNVVTPLDLEWAIKNNKDPQTWLAAARMDAVQRNAEISIRLNNYIWSVQWSLIWAACFLGVAIMAVAFKII